MNPHISEDKTIAFPCPKCEIEKNEINLAEKEGDHFVCRKCRSSYQNREHANDIRKELKQLLSSK